MNLLKRATFLTLVTIGLVAFYAPSAMAQAIVVTDGGCGVLDGNGNGASIDTSQPGVQVHSVITPSGNIKLTCNGGSVPNDSGSAVLYDFDSTGISCGTTYGSTQDWHSVVSKSGRVSLQCFIHP